MDFLHGLASPLFSIYPREMKTRLTSTPAPAHQCSRQLPHTQSPNTGNHTHTHALQWANVSRTSCHGVLSASEKGTTWRYTQPPDEPQETLPRRQRRRTASSLQATLKDQQQAQRARRGGPLLLVPGSWWGQRARKGLTPNSTAT